MEIFDLVNLSAYSILPQCIVILFIKTGGLLDTMPNRESILLFYGVSLILILIVLDMIVKFLVFLMRRFVHFYLGMLNITSYLAYKARIIF